MNSITNILQHFCLDFKQLCIRFWNFQNNYFIESFPLPVYDSSSRVLCTSLRSVFLHACRNYWKTLSNAFLDATNVDWFLTHSIFMLANFWVLRVHVVCTDFVNEIIFSTVIGLDLASLLMNVTHLSQVFYKKIAQIMTATIFSRFS